jgi:hypothetical protein
LLVFELKVIIQGIKFKRKSFTLTIPPFHPREQAAEGFYLPVVTGASGGEAFAAKCFHK